MTRAVLLIAAVLLLSAVSAARAQERDVWRSILSSVTMTETVTGAELHFVNSNSDRTQEHHATLTAGGVTVAIWVSLGHGSRADTLTVETPPGWIAIPRSLTIPDGADGRVQIVPLDMEMM